MGIAQHLCLQIYSLTPSSESSEEAGINDSITVKSAQRILPLLSYTKKPISSIQELRIRNNHPFHLPHYGLWEKLFDQTGVVGLQLGGFDGLVAFAVQVVRVECTHGRKRLFVRRVGEMCVCTLTVPPAFGAM